MMQLSVENLGRKFGREWIFRNFSYTFESGEKYALVGNNGSGKSTLLKILGSCLLPSEGKIDYTYQANRLMPEEVYQYTSLVAPYTTVVEEMTLIELIVFFKKFKPLQISTDVFLEELRLDNAKNKMVKHFSSGMKQRLQLGFAFYSNSKLLLLDEPTSNLDAANAAWYQQLVSTDMPDKVLIISSNQPSEYSCCKHKVSLASLKVV